MPGELTTMVGVGAVTATSARIWARSDRMGLHRLRIGDRVVEVAVEGDADQTAAWTVEGLAADTAYTYELHAADGTRIGTGRFTTAPASPDAPGSFRFAAYSCHQPFDRDGNVRPDARAMLLAAHQVMRDRDVRFALAMGDQVYADHPACMSVFTSDDILACSREEVRRRYHQLYRRTWSTPELAPLYAEFPTWPMLDDHDVVNNLGSLVEHAQPAWQALRDGALDAFFDYQASRVLSSRPVTFDHGFRWGSTAVYQLDIRSARYVLADRTQLVSEAQHVAFRDFLVGNRDARLLVLVVSVPIAYVPTWFSALAARFTDQHEGADRWSYKGCLPDRDRVLGALLEQAAAAPHQRIILVSGDIHVGSAFELAWDHGPVFHQLTASALTNDVGPRDGIIYELVTGIERTIPCGDHVAHVNRIAGDPDGNPISRLNLGIIHVDDDGARARVRFELVGATVDGEPVTAFLSPWLG